MSVLKFLIVCYGMSVSLPPQGKPYWSIARTLTPPARHEGKQAATRHPDPFSRNCFSRRQLNILPTFFEECWRTVGDSRFVSMSVRVSRMSRYSYVDYWPKCGGSGESQFRPSFTPSTHEPNNRKPYMLRQRFPPRSNLIDFRGGC